MAAAFRLDLVNRHLKSWATHRQITEPYEELDVYSNEPSSLPKTDGYHYVRNKKKGRNESTKKLDRIVAGKGRWRIEGTKERMYSSATGGELAGMRRRFTYYAYTYDQTRQKCEKRTNWIMNELSLAEDGKNNEDFVMCKITETGWAGTSPIPTPNSNESSNNNGVGMFASSPQEQAGNRNQANTQAVDEDYDPFHDLSPLPGVDLPDDFNYENRLNMIHEQFQTLI